MAQEIWKRSIRETSLMMHSGKYKWGWDILQCRIEFLAKGAGATNVLWRPSPSERMRMLLAHYAYVQECGPESGLKFYQDANTLWKTIATLDMSFDIGVEVSDADKLQKVSYLMLKSENILNNSMGCALNAEQIERYNHVEHNLVTAVQCLQTIGNGKHYQVIDAY
jgi:hypothetical protein